jgi:hypothetical protein
MLNATIQATHRFRYVNNGSAYSGNISFEDVADSMCVATAAAVAYRLFDAVKIKEVEVWCANAAGDAANTVEIEWLNTLLIGGPGSTISDTALGLHDIAHVVARPPKGSKADFWLDNSTGLSGGDFNIFRLACPKGSVVDITLECAIYDNDTAVAVTGAVAGATVGKTYARPLDSAQGTAILVPVSYDFI